MTYVPHPGYMGVCCPELRFSRYGIISINEIYDDRVVLWVSRKKWAVKLLT